MILAGQFFDRYKNNGTRVKKSLLSSYVMHCNDERYIANRTSKDIMISYTFNQQLCNAKTCLLST